MLRTLVTAAVVVGVVSASAAYADGGPPAPVVVSGDNHKGEVTTTVSSPGSAGSVQTVSTSSGSVSCQWKLDNTDNTVMLGGAQPGSDAAQAAQQGGLFYNVICSDGSMYLGVFVPGANGGPAVPTPASLAQQAVNRMQLPAPEVRRNPAGDALVNLATWWWIHPAQWRPMTQRTAVGPVWAEVTARPVRSVWDAGDGTPPLSCAGGGTPYDASRSPDAQSTNCSHTYTESSGGQPQTGPDPNDRFFTVTVTVYWQVSFVGAGGAGGALPVMTRTTRFPLRVVERQTVVTRGSG